MKDDFSNITSQIIRADCDFPRRFEDEIDDRTIDLLIIQSFLLFICFLINTTDAIHCPSSYNTILIGCYKIMNGSNMTWPSAQQYRNNEQNTIITNRTAFITHLVALESAFEMTSLLYRVKANGTRSFAFFSR